MPLQVVQVVLRLLHGPVRLARLEQQVILAHRVMQVQVLLRVVQAALRPPHGPAKLALPVMRVVRLRRFHLRLTPAHRLRR